MDLRQSSDEALHTLINFGKQLLKNITDDDEDESNVREPYMIIKKNIYNIFIPGVDKKDIVVYIENNQIVLNAVYYGNILDNSEYLEKDRCIIYKKYINIVNNMTYDINYKNGILQIIINNDSETKEFLKVN